MVRQLRVVRLGTEEYPPELCVVDGPVAIRIEHRPVSHFLSFRAIAARVAHPAQQTNKHRITDAAQGQPHRSPCVCALVHSAVGQGKCGTR